MSAGALAFSIDEKQLLIGGEHLVAFRTDTWTRNVLMKDAGDITSLAMDSSGRTIAYGTYADEVGEFNVVSGAKYRLLQPPPGRVQQIRTVSFSPDGKLVASSIWSSDGK
jgi:hypothetical protein